MLWPASFVNSFTSNFSKTKSKFSYASNWTEKNDKKNDKLLEWVVFAITEYQFLEPQKITHAMCKYQVGSNFFFIQFSIQVLKIKKVWHLVKTFIIIKSKTHLHVQQIVTKKQKNAN